MRSVNYLHRLKPATIPVTFPGEVLGIKRERFFFFFWLKVIRLSGGWESHTVHERVCTHARTPARESDTLVLIPPL